MGVTIFDSMEKQNNKLSLGQPKLDKILEGGLHPSQIALIIGRPSIGKSRYLDLLFANHLSRNSENQQANSSSSNACGMKGLTSQKFPDES
jgi:predicted ATP-dependent serine protease